MRARVQRGRVTHDRWLVSYADFITLLFSFFVVLYAFSRASQKQQAQLPQSIDSAFKSLGIFSSSSRPAAPVDGRDTPALPLNVLMSASVQSPAEVRNDLNRVRRDLTQRLSNRIAQQTVVIKMDRDGLVISLREAGFFSSGSAIPHPDALPVLRQIAASLATTPYDIRVEGHTDNVPIHTAQFDSNWELSSARANHIARLLLELNATSPDHLSVAGYAEFHPDDTNATPEGRANNRRVDLVVLPRTKIDLGAPADTVAGPWRKITDGDE